MHPLFFILIFLVPLLVLCRSASPSTEHSDHSGYLEYYYHGPHRDPLPGTSPDPEVEAWLDSVVCIYSFPSENPDDVAWIGGDGVDVVDQLRIFTLPAENEQLFHILKVVDEFPDKATVVLVKAARKGALTVVEAMLERGACPIGHEDCSAKTITKKNPMGESDGRAGYIETVHWPDFPSVDAAAEKGHVHCVAALLDAIARHPNQSEEMRNIAAWNAFLVAVSHGQSAVVEYLLTSRLVNPPELHANTPYPQPLIQEAAKAGSLATVRALLTTRLDAPEVCYEGQPACDWNAWLSVNSNAVYAAAASGSAELLEFLLAESGFPIDDADGVWKGDLLYDANTTWHIVHAFELAAREAHIDTMDLLLTYLVRPDAANYSLDVNLFPLSEGHNLRDAFIRGMYLAAHRKRTEAYMRLVHLHLQQNRAEETQHADRDLFAEHLNIAAYRDNVPLVKFLVEDLQLDPNLPSESPLDSEDYLPLEVAAIQGNVDVAKYLIEDCGASLFGQASLGTSFWKRTPLALAMMWLKSDMVRLLLQHGGPVDGVSPSGIPDFKSLDMAVNVIFDSAGEVTLMWGKVDSEEMAIECFPSPCPDRCDRRRGCENQWIYDPLDGKRNAKVVQLNLTADDETWWEELQFTNGSQILPQAAVSVGRGRVVREIIDWWFLKC